MIFSKDVKQNVQVTLLSIQGLIFEESLNIERLVRKKTSSNVLKREEVSIDCVINLGKYNIEYSVRRCKMTGNPIHIDFPITYAELPRNSVIYFHIFERYGGKFLGGTGIKLFDERGFLETGEKDLKISKEKKFVGYSPNAMDLFYRNEELFYGSDRGKSQYNELYKIFAHRRRKIGRREKEKFLRINIPGFCNGNREVCVFNEEQRSSLFGELLLKEDCKSIKSGIRDYVPPQRPKFYKAQILRKGSFVSYAGMRQQSFDFVNLSQKKHQIMVKGKDPSRECKPTVIEKKVIEDVLTKTALEELTESEKYLMWEFSYWITREKSGFVRVLKGVQSRWNELPNVKRVIIDIMKNWEGSLKKDDLLELLSFRYENIPEVRNFAVKFLGKKNDEYLLSILAQLVQSLKYENDMMESEFYQLLLSRCTKGFYFSSKFYWHLKIEISNYRDPFFNDKFQLKESRILINLEEVMKNFLDSIDKSFVRELKKQDVFMRKLTNKMREFRILSKELKVKKLRTLFHNIEEKEGWKELFPFWLPLDPSVRVYGINHRKAKVFGSKTAPYLIPFFVNHEKTKSYAIVFKGGDDLRQDALVVQMVKLLDEILQRNAMDLRLTPYDVLCTDLSDGGVGMIQCVPNVTSVEDIKSKGISFAQYYKNKVLKKNLSKEENLKEFKKCRDRFLLSCAGYCVISHFLGFGDRHLDNILVQDSGKMVHIDFGFILGWQGRNKPFAPQIKLIPLMVQFITGGNLEKTDLLESRRFLSFLEYCKRAFSIIRKNAKLIINCFILMLHSKIEQVVAKEDIGTDMQFRYIKKLKDNLLLHMDDRTAEIEFINIIIRNYNCWAGAFEDYFHTYVDKIVYKLI